ncbi:hypothetical protein [Nocardia jiangxiensis]|uniref:hypothetical protein n=1 Tax=Nocardia jiangxiensis TaxID=282685 RepID=UPI0002F4DFC4|nr:hypothetical protein [Nocardia jiangxiensis]
MTNNEMMLAALQLVKEEIGNVIESLQFKKELGRLGGDYPEEVIDAALASFKAQLPVTEQYIDYFGMLVAKESGL